MILQRCAEAMQDYYQLDAVPDPQEFLIDPETFGRYCARHPHINPQCDETLLIESVDGCAHVGLYIEPRLLARVAASTPEQVLHAGNIAETCTVIEGVSHLVCLCWKVEQRMPCTQLELELQAEVDKYLLCSTWLRQQGRSASLLLTTLFANYHLAGGVTGAAAGRYHRASQLAARFCHVLEQSYQRRHRLPRLMDCARDFYRRTHWQKLRYLAG